jgi:predicted metal-binding protein
VFVYGDQEADDIEIQKHIDSLDKLINWFGTPEQLEECGLSRISDIFPGIDLK